MAIFFYFVFHWKRTFKRFAHVNANVSHNLLSIYIFADMLELHRSCYFSLSQVRFFFPIHTVIILCVGSYWTWFVQNISIQTIILQLPISINVYILFVLVAAFSSLLFYFFRRCFLLWGSWKAISKDYYAKYCKYI